MERTKTPEQRIDWLAGQVSALSISVHVLIRLHSDRATAAKHLHEELERMHAKALTTNLPDEMLRGMEFVRDTFLLKPQPDPGQPSIR